MDIHFTGIYKNMKCFKNEGIERLVVNLKYKIIGNEVLSFLTSRLSPINNEKKRKLSDIQQSCHKTIYNPSLE